MVAMTAAKPDSTQPKTVPVAMTGTVLFFGLGSMKCFTLAPLRDAERGQG